MVGQTRRSTRPFMIGLGVVALAGILAIAYSVTRQKGRGVTEVDLRADPAQARGYLLGDSTAPVQVLEFADFECPACMQFSTLTEPDVRARLVDTKQISFRFYDYPLPMHKNTWEASNAAACADEQGKFWPMHDAIFANQDRWDGQATSSPKSPLKELARSIGLDVGKWEDCYDEQRYRSRIAANRAEAERRHIGSTPTFIIGNKLIPGSMGIDQFMRYVAEARGTAPAVAPAAGAGTAAAPNGAVAGARQ